MTWKITKPSNHRPGGHLDQSELVAVIDMAVQETTLLPHRLARSAKDLARASLSGVACELKDPRMAKQAGSSSQAAAAAHQHGGSQSGEVTKSRPALFSRENSFRNLPKASASRAVEEDFNRFQENDLRQNEWMSPDFTACVKVNPESGKYQVGSYAAQNEPFAPHYLTSNANAKERVKDAMGLQTSRSDTSTVNDDQRDSKADHARAAAAARRLEQISAQIQRNLAMQMLQQDDASVQTSLVPTTVMDLQNESAQRTSHQQPRTPQSSHAETISDSQHQVSRHHRQTPSLNRTHASVSEDAKDEQDDSQLLFHCPYYACHQNLQRLLSSSSPSRKMCVHAGCGEQLETRSAWIEHIALPHHNLQG
jgi:hypothetical protein